VEKGGSAIITHVPRKTSSSLRSSGEEDVLLRIRQLSSRRRRVGPVYDGIRLHSSTNDDSRRELRTYTCSIFEAAFLSDLDAACYVVKHMAFNARGIAYGSEERGPLIFRSQANQRFSVPGELIVPLAIRQFGVSNGSWKTTCARRKERERERRKSREFHMHRRTEFGW